MAQGDPNPQATATPDPQATAEPDPRQVIADLQRQLEAATGSSQKALDVTKDSLRAANPGLPQQVFEAADLDALIANVEAHKATAAHVLEAAQAAKPPAPAAPINPAAGTTRQVQVPNNLRGITRIAFALNNPGPGMTE